MRVLRFARPVLLVLLLVLAVVVGRLIHHGGQPASQAAPLATSSPTAAASPAATEPPPSPSVPRPSTGSATHPPTQTPAQAAEHFVAVWLNTSGGQRVWLQRLRPITDGQLLDGFSTTDVAAVPHATVKAGSVRIASRPDRDDAIALVDTTGGTFQVSMANQGGAWKVTSIAPAES